MRSGTKREASKANRSLSTSFTARFGFWRTRDERTMNSAPGLSCLALLPGPKAPDGPILFQRDSNQLAARSNPRFHEELLKC